MLQGTLLTGRLWDLLLTVIVFFLLLASLACGGGTTSTTPPPQQESNPVPVIVSLSPSSALAGTAATTAVTVNGTGFVQGATAQWNHTSRTATFVSTTQLQVALTAADLSAAGIGQITVTNPTPGGGTSGSAMFTINNPSPQISSVTPGTVTINNANSALTINGAGFVSSSTVTWNSSTRTATFISPTQLQINLTSSDLTTAGSAQILVSNATPGGGNSGPSQLTIIYAAPQITSISPATVPTGASFVLTINGTGFVPASVGEFSGTSRPTTYVSSSQISIAGTAADAANIGTAQITVVTPTPGGGTSGSLPLVVASFPTPTLTAANPTSIMVNSPDTTLSLSGTGFTNASTVQVDGQNLSPTYLNSQLIGVVLPAADLTTVGATLSVTVTNPGTPASNALTIPIGPYPLPVLTSVSPASTATGGPAFTLSVSGSGFVPASVVRWNGSDRPTTYGNSGVLTANITASDIQTLGNSNVTVFSPTPGGGTSSPAAFTTFVPLTTNDLIYDPTRSLLWASVPSSAGPALGNSVISIDPYSGALGTPIWVGSEPNLLALSGDGTTLWVSLNGSPALRKIDLTNRILTSIQPYFPGGWGGSFYAGGIAVMPGTTSTVAVYSNQVSIFDDATARPNAGIVGTPYLAFGSTASTLYGESYNNGLSIFTINNSGIASTTSAANSGGFSNDLRYDSGRLYLTSGGVLDGTTGSLIGTFAAHGSVAPDSGLGRAFILNANPTYLADNQITAFDLNTFLPIGTLPVGGVEQGISSAGPLVRWGADGLAFRTPDQIFILRDPLVKDLSGSPADVGVSTAAPASTSTGTNTTITITATNNGPNAAPGTTVLDTVPASAMLASATPSQGSCVTAPDLRCDLGTLASGAAATISVVLVPATAGTLSNPVSVVAASNDPNTSNNSATSTITVTGSGYNPAPVLSSIAPNSAVTGSASFSLTVDGTGFANTSTVNWNGTSLPTSFTSSNELKATVSASLIAASGSADITVSNGAPGGGTSASLPFAIIQAISLTTNDVVFEPFSRKIYATIPSTATEVAGNSVVSIDPLTGAIGTPIPMGSEPTRMAISDDGVFLYVTLAGSNMVRRVNLLTGIADTPFTTTSPVLQSPFTPSDLAVMPGDSSVLATVGYSDGIQVWDVTATGATQRTLTNALVNDVYEGSVLAWGDSTHLYSNDEGLSPSSFHRFLVGPTSFAEEDSTYLDAVDGRIAYSGGLIFTDGGGVVNPSPAPPNTPRLVGRYSSGGVSAADASINRIFFLSQNSFSTETTTIAAFDASHFTPVGTMILPSSAANDLIRWGADGLAFRTSVDFSGQGTPQVVILRGSAVLPRSLTPNPVPSVASASPSVTAPATNTWLTLSGSQFVPGAVAMWNGSPRTTIFLNAGLLRVAIPATDLATHQTATLQVVNPSPGGGASGTLNFVVN